MPGPLHATTTPPILYLFAFRYRDTLTGRWVTARYRAEPHEIRARYAEWELVGEPEIRRPRGGSFNPWRSTALTQRRPGRWRVVGVAT